MIYNGALCIFLYFSNCIYYYIIIFLSAVTVQQFDEFEER